MHVNSGGVRLTDVKTLVALTLPSSGRKALAFCIPHARELYRDFRIVAAAASAWHQSSPEHGCRLQAPQRCGPLAARDEMAETISI